MENKVKEFWENCSTTFAHITADDWLKDESSLIKSYSRNLKKFNIDPTNKTVIDYGIGGGYLGKYLLSSFKILKYIGIDIAKRSIDSSKKNLSTYKNVEFHLTPVEFSKFKADLFISLAVIQHFPSKEYLDDFLSNINSSEIGELLLQIRYNPDNKFSKSYKTHSDARLGCQTNSDYILKILTNYQLIDVSEIEESSRYQYLYIKKK